MGSLTHSAGPIALGANAYVPTQPTGREFWVFDEGKDSWAGTSKDQPTTTLASALAECVAGRNDVIHFYPTHNETLDGAVAIDKAGVTLFAHGSGASDNRCRLNYGTTDSQLNITANNVTLQNMVFHLENDVDAVVTGLTIGASGVTIRDCAFVQAGASRQALTAITTSAAAISLLIEDSYFVSPVAGGNSAISLIGALSVPRIRNNRMIGTWANAGIHNPTGNVQSFLMIHGNYIWNFATGQHAIELVSACTGDIFQNTLRADTNGSVINPGSCKSTANIFPDGTEAP